MPFDNVGSILRSTSPFSSLKLLLIAASYSRPKLSPLLSPLVRLIAKDGEVTVWFRANGRLMKGFLRLSDMDSDLRSALDLMIRDTYDLDPGFSPDLVIDGGANVGLFTLRASASTPGTKSLQIVACEPLPRNIIQLKKHLAENRIVAKVLEGCLGGHKSSIPFYCRGAIDSSFDSQKPYTSIIDMPVYTLQEAIDLYPAERILIKLDIEGMEIEVLKAFVPLEKRPVYLVGELHSFAVNDSLLRQIFVESGWTFEYGEIADNHATFRACSPAALPLLVPQALV